MEANRNPILRAKVRKKKRKEKKEVIIKQTNKLFLLSKGELNRNIPTIEEIRNEKALLKYSSDPFIDAFSISQIVNVNSFGGLFETNTRFD